MQENAGVAVSMEQVAREAGVAVSTVSRALRGDRRIAPATRSKVKEAAERLGYRPNPLIAALMARLRAAYPPTASCNLAWLDVRGDSPHWWKTNAVARAFYTGAARRAELAGFALDRTWALDPTATRESITQHLLSRGVRGVLLQGFESGESLGERIPLQLDQFVTVSVGTIYRNPDLHFASNDQYASARTAVQHLWALGYRRIGYWADPHVESVVQRRFAGGYQMTVQVEFGGEALPLLLSVDPKNVRQWLEAHRPEAVVSAYPRWRDIFSALGLAVPADIGFAHLHVRADDPDTSGICQNSEEVGAAAVELLVSELSGTEFGVPRLPKGLLIPGRWVPGRTVRQIR
jgi:Transcriptional regulators